MKYNILMGIIIGMILISLASAEIEKYPQGSTNNLQFTCNTELGTITNGNLNISMYNPKGVEILTNVETTKQYEGSFNYTFQFLSSGTYKVKMKCYNDSLSGDTEGYYEIVGVGNSDEKGITQTAFFLGLALILSMGTWMKLSKFFGSFMIMIIGVGVVVTITENGWIGYTIMSIGFIALLYALLSPKKRR